MLAESVAWVCLIWYCFVVIVCSIGYVQLYRYYTRPSRLAVCLTSLPPSQLPHITIIRPVKGLEPRLYACLASTFRQTYPSSKLSIRFCIATRTDPAFPVLLQLLADFPDFDVQVLVEAEDPFLHPSYAANGDAANGAIRSHGDGGETTEGSALGPNPKIRNMSRAYREAKGDVVWIVDCNVWVGSGVAGRMVDLLEGHGAGRPHKFVHQLPLVVDVLPEELPSPSPSSSSSSSSTENSNAGPRSLLRSLTYSAGGRLEELFMSSSHAKFYTAINTVLIAPCIVGKSNMFRRSHLAALTSSATAAGTRTRHGPGIDFFSDNICEDHLIGDMLWKKPQPFEIQPPASRTLLLRLAGWGFLREPKPPAESTTTTTAPASTPASASASTPVPAPAPALDGNDSTTSSANSANGAQARTKKFGNHALLHGSPCIQPLSAHPLPSYLHRRVRWLRVRKFTVLLATLVEPGTESLLCSLYGAFALTTLPWARGALARAVGALALALGLELGDGFGGAGAGDRFGGGAAAAAAAAGASGAAAAAATGAGVRWVGIGTSRLTTPDFWATRPAFLLLWTLSMLAWMAVDRTLYAILHSGRSVEVDAHTPDFARGRVAARRSRAEWALAWVGREALALPVWAWAVLGGVTVEWRGKRFWVGVDMRVREIVEGG